MQPASDDDDIRLLTQRSALFQENFGASTFTALRPAVPFSFNTLMTKRIAASKTFHIFIKAVEERIARIVAM